MHQIRVNEDNVAIGRREYDSGDELIVDEATYLDLRRAGRFGDGLLTYVRDIGDGGDGGGGGDPEPQPVPRITHRQASPAATWSIPHDLDTPRPLTVLVLDEDLSEPVYTDVSYPNPSTVVIEWPSPVTGYAHLT